MPDSPPRQGGRKDEGPEGPAVAIVDLNVTAASPIGTGILDLIEGLHSKYRFVVVAADFESAHPESVEHVRVRIPPGPAFVKELSWPILARRAFLRDRFLRTRRFVVRATQGQFQGAEICDAHFCHRAYLDRYFGASGTKGVRRITRSLVHRHGARLERRAFRRARIVVVSSMGLRREIAETYPSVTEKLVHIPNPLNVSRFARAATFDRDAVRASNGYGREHVVFLFVGLGDFARKGLAYGIRALAVVDSPEARLLVVGGTEGEIAIYRKIAADAGVGPRIMFVGFQSDIRPYLWMSDVFLFPTIYEAAPKVVDQALAASLPVIGTRVNGIEDRIEPGVNGWFVERSDESVAGAMRTAVEDRARLRDMGRRASEVAEKLDRRFYVERWDELLADILAAR
ncbi:MAG: hypothetical protein C5B48_05610 [Candidatus Rokuibacteriota bacterium]|nr:MAG: hypothetical protein C5B48_05610 [Candidatus Rokubacteria bacterium]